MYVEISLKPSRQSSTPAGRLKWATEKDKKKKTALNLSPSDGLRFTYIQTLACFVPNVDICTCRVPTKSYFCIFIVV